MKNDSQIASDHRTWLAGWWPCVLILFTLLMPAGRVCGQQRSDSELLWYDRPAEEWTEALPVGNGRLGCMVFGGVSDARYQFNEDTLWTGGPHNYAHVGAAKYLPEIRRLLFAGRQHDAEQLAMREFMSVPLHQCAYQPFGDVLIHFKGDDHANGYRRSLDLTMATTTTEYRIDDVHYIRKVIASYPDQAIVIHFACDRPGRLAFQAKLTTPHAGAKTARVDNATLLLTGKVRDTQTREGDHVDGRMRFAAHLRVLSRDGAINSTDDGISVSGASEATLVLTAATNFVNFRDLSGDPESRSRNQLDQISHPWAQIYKDHVSDYQRLYNRVSFHLGTAPTKDAPTDERILANSKQCDPDLIELFFQYGRYLMIASSRPGGQPANLQGIWNDSLDPPWGSKYTTNINLEMNYWLTEPCNLSECEQPLFDAMREVAESGRDTAREQYGMPGWVLHHNFDIWRGTAPINASNHGIWPSGGAWLCQQLWEHYLYSGDKEFLQDTAYPLMKGAAEFFGSYLLEDPRNNRRWLISGPSNSPEIGGLVMGPTMDHQIIRSLFANTIQASEILGVDADLRKRLTSTRPRIAPNQVGRYGQLQEWLEDIDDPNVKHRHVSHLWGLFPGSEITPDTPKWFAAAQKSLEFRGDEGTGWSRAWKINFWARLRDGDHANRVLQGLLTLTGSKRTSYRGGGVYPNLFDAHPPFQIDGNFGATSGICEMLVQSHRVTNDGKRLIELLPALPHAWPDGELKGIRTRSGFEIGLKWADGKLSRCHVRSLLGVPAVLRCGENDTTIALSTGKTATFDEHLRPL
jgi:alpha-L-fucosidase 2